MPSDSEYLLESLCLATETHLNGIQPQETGIGHSIKFTFIVPEAHQKTAIGTLFLNEEIVMQEVWQLHPTIMEDIDIVRGAMATKMVNAIFVLGFISIMESKEQ